MLEFNGVAPETTHQIPYVTPINCMSVFLINNLRPNGFLGVNENVVLPSQALIAVFFRRLGVCACHAFCIADAALPIYAEYRGSLRCIS